MPVTADRGKRHARVDHDGGPLAAVLACWPIDVDDGFERAHPADPWVAIVHESIADYRRGDAERASSYWSDGIVWRVDGGTPPPGEWTGPEGVFAYHHLLGRLTGGTFRQRLVALQPSGGPLVEAYLRTTATRDGRALDLPTLAVFEIHGGRIDCVTELPGDRDAWARFWADRAA